MTISILKHSKGRATITVDGRAYSATINPATKHWRVMTDSGFRETNSGKVKSLASIFAPAVTVNGASAPKASRPRAPRAPGVRRARTTGPAFAPKPDALALTLTALVSLEAALVAHATAKGVTPEVDKQFARYQKIKGLALSNPNANEASAALRKALSEAVELVKAVC